MIQKPISILAGILTLLILSGCAGFTQGSSAKVVLTSSTPQEIELIIVPNEKTPSDPLACSETQQPSWCQWESNPSQTIQSFKIDPQFAPFAVYVKNKHTGNTRDARVQIYLDGIQGFDNQSTYNAGETRLVARVFPGNSTPIN